MKGAPEGVALAHEKYLTKEQFFEEFLEADRHYDDTEKKLAYLDSAWAKAALGLRTLGLHRFAVGNRRRAFKSLQAEKRSLDVYRTRFESGDGQAILAAIKLCGEHCLPLPEWLALAFSASLERFTHPFSERPVHSLDDAFPAANRSRNSSKAEAREKAVAREKQDWALGSQLWLSAWNVAESDKELSSVDAVVKKVLDQKSWGIALTKAKRLVLLVDKNQAELLGKREKQPLSQMLAKRRKI